MSAGSPVLVIACGDAKRPERSAASDLYLGPLWTTFRKWERELGGSSPVEIWVVSAKHGLIPGSTRIDPYDKRLTAATMDRFVDKLRKSSLDRPIVFAGPDLYRQALERAGFSVEALGGRGWGGMRQNLLGWLDGQAARAGAMRLGATVVDLDALIAKHRKPRS